MKLITYCILLFLFIGLIPVATAVVPSHSLSGVYDDTVMTSFVYDGDVKDEVTPVLMGGIKMNFMWIRPDGSLRRMADIYLNDATSYIDVVTNTNVEGLWSVQGTEISPIDTSGSTVKFKVAALPEFSFGSFISLIFAGVLYFMMRRTIKGSVNVG